MIESYVICDFLNELNGFRFCDIGLVNLHCVVLKATFIFMCFITDGS